MLGTGGFIDLQFNPGNALSQPATAQITNFQITGGGSTGAVILPNNGDVTGSLPGTVTFDNGTALNETLNVDKIRTGDLGGKATTAEFTKALVSRVANS